MYFIYMELLKISLTTLIIDYFYLSFIKINLIK